MADLRLDHVTEGDSTLRLGPDCRDPTNLCLNKPFENTADLNLGGLAPPPTPIPSSEVVVAAVAGGVVADILASQLTTATVDAVVADVSADIVAMGAREAVVDAVVAEPVPLIVGYRVFDAVVDAVVSEVTPESTSIYMVDVWRGNLAAFASPYAKAAPLFAETRVPNLPMVSLSNPLRLNWTPAAPMDQVTRSVWQQGEPHRSETRLRWETAAPVKVEIRAPFRDLLPHTGIQRQVWGEAGRHAADTRLRHAYPPERRYEPALRWEKAAHREQSRGLVYGYPPERRTEVRGRWEYGRGVVSLWPRPDVWTPPPLPPRVITGDLALNCEAYLSGPADLLFGQLCGGVPPIAGQIVIPRRRTYLVVHNITVLRLPDNFPIQASRVALSLDVDSWAWGFSATLLGKEALDAVLPSALGEPVTLEVNINGYTWHVLVEDWSENREFGKRSVSVKGRGLSALLASPYQLPGSGIMIADMTVQQVFNAHLPEFEGWTLTWETGLADWLVPAGAWSWQNQSPITAIHQAATGAGLVVVPGRAAKSLHIQARYPVLPWDYATATPNLVVPDSAVLGLARQQSPMTQANAVFVQGGDTGGILARVIRTGSAGDRVAATVNSPLLTHTDAARLLGGRVLAANHPAPDVRSLTLPMGGVFALGAVGDLVRVDPTAGDSSYGIINAVSLEASRSANAASVRQTLSVGESTPNQWAKFRRLLPGDPLLTGVIEGVYGDGTASVLLTGGGSVRVRGAGTVGQAVYVRAGRIEGNAPSLSAVEMSV